MAQGYITDIKESDGRFGKSYQLYVDNKSLGFMKFPPKGIGVGDFVEYETEKKGQYENLKPGTLSKIDPPAGMKAPIRPAPSTITMDKQDVISRQAALNSALSFVQILQAAGAIPEGKTLSADKKADKIEAILNSYVKRFYELNTGSEYTIPDISTEDAAKSWDEQE